MWAAEWAEASVEVGLDGAAPVATTATGGPFLVGRAAYTLNLTGPTVAVDTACSSSLVAAHQGAAAVRGGECGVAGVAGVNLFLSPRTAARICRLQALAPDGRCKALDANGDGYGRGEAGVLVVLQAGGGGRADTPLAVFAVCRVAAAGLAFVGEGWVERLSRDTLPAPFARKP